MTVCVKSNAPPPPSTPHFQLEQGIKFSPFDWSCNFFLLWSGLPLQTLAHLLTCIKMGIFSSECPAVVFLFCSVQTLYCLQPLISSVCSCWTGVLNDLDLMSWSRWAGKTEFDLTIMKLCIVGQCVYRMHSKCFEQMFVWVWGSWSNFRLWLKINVGVYRTFHLELLSRSGESKRKLEADFVLNNHYFEFLAIFLVCFWIIHGLFFFFLEMKVCKVALICCGKAIACNMMLKCQNWSFIYSAGISEWWLLHVYHIVDEAMHVNYGIFYVINGWWCVK